MNITIQLRYLYYILNRINGLNHDVNLRAISVFRQDKRQSCYVDFLKAGQPGCLNNAEIWRGGVVNNMHRNCWDQA